MSDKKQVGARLRAARKASGLTVADLAERFRDVAPHRVRQRLPSLRDLERTIRGHEAGEHTVGPRYRLLYTRAFNTPEEALFHPGHERPSDVRIAHYAAATVLEDADGRERPADADYVQKIRETNQHLISLDSLYGGNDVLPMGMRIFRAAHAKLASGRHDRAVERDLQAATGETAEVTSWVAYDADKQQTARQVVHEALLLSRLAGDRSMELFELSHLALLALHTRRSGEALSISEAALDDPRLPPRVRALFAIRQARALAQLDAPSAAFRSLNEAASIMDEGISERDPSWTWWLDDAELAWHRGMLYVELNEWGEATEHLAISVAGRTDARRRASSRSRARYNDLAHLLDALVRVRAWNEAESVMMEVLDQAAEVGSGRTTRLVVEVADRVISGDAPQSVTDSAENLRCHLIV